MSSLSKVCDYMVRDPVCAYKWQPVSFIRQQMLANSFTYLPVFMEASWNLISDSNVARYLLADNNQRKVRLAKTLRNAVDLQELQLETAKTVEPETPIKKVVQNFKGKPVLVCRQGHLEDLLGILTAFDLL